MLMMGRYQLVVVRIQTYNKLTNIKSFVEPNSQFPIEGMSTVIIWDLLTVNVGT